MKLIKQIFSIIIIISISSCSNSGKKANLISFKDPVEYNNYIVDIQRDVAMKLLFFGETMGNSEDGEFIKNEGYKLLKHINKKISELKRLDKFRGESYLKDAAIEQLMFYRSVVINEYRELVEIIIETNEMADELDDDKYDEYAQRLVKTLENLDRKEAILDDKILQIQIRFANENYMELQ
ncbi:MAG: LIC11966 family surface protein [Bacteroidales bacterium]|jgi:hypothetical protein|nr:hypothetical protein [Bacteroidales bacterium]